MAKYALDKLDKRILYELDKNARIPASQIAKKVRTSPEVINYRIKQLEKNEIITCYQTSINLKKVGILQFKMCLTLKHITSRKLVELIKKLKAIPEVKWIVSCQGAFDMIVSLETTSLKKVELLKNKVVEVLGEHADRKVISIMVESGIYDRDFLMGCGERKHADLRVCMDDSDFVDLDDSDMKILRAISGHSRDSIIALAETVGLTPRTVHHRLRRLKKKNIITGYSIGLNYEKLGLLLYRMHIYLSSPSEKRVRSLVQYLGCQPNVLAHIRIVGSWDLEPELEVYNEQEYNAILADVKDKFSDIIKRVETVLVTKEHKLVYF